MLPQKILKWKTKIFLAPPNFTLKTRFLFKTSFEHYIRPGLRFEIIINVFFFTNYELI
jgi:hypothetical protein